MAEVKTETFAPEGVELESCFCPLDCFAGDEVVLTGADRINGIEGRFVVVRCINCRLMRTNPRPTSRTIGLYYPSNYGPYLGTIPRETTELSNFLRPLGKIFMDFRAESIPKIPPGKVLEIGCASGGHLAKLVSKGWEVVGVEFSATAAQVAQKSGFDVRIGALEDVSLPDREFDLVVGWMVLEHLHRPVDALKKLHACTSQGAWLVISVPNCASLSFYKFKEDWFPLQIPTHLYHFTPDSLSRVLSVGGWEVKRIMQQRFLVDWVLSFALLLESRNKDSRLAKFLLKIPTRPSGLLVNLILYPLAAVAAWFGEGSRMTVWARRRDDIPC